MNNEKCLTTDVKSILLEHSDYIIPDGYNWFIAAPSIISPYNDKYIVVVVPKFDALFSQKQSLPESNAPYQDSVTLVDVRWFFTYGVTSGNIAYLETLFSNEMIYNPIYKDYYLELQGFKEPLLARYNEDGVCLHIVLTMEHIANDCEETKENFDKIVYFRDFIQGYVDYRKDFSDCLRVTNTTHNIYKTIINDNLMNKKKTNWEKETSALIQQATNLWKNKALETPHTRKMVTEKVVEIFVKDIVKAGLRVEMR